MEGIHGLSAGNGDEMTGGQGRSLLGAIRLRMKFLQRRFGVHAASALRYDFAWHFGSGNLASSRPRRSRR
jgi:hypothetical protein